MLTEFAYLSEHILLFHSDMGQHEMGSLLVSSRWPVGGRVLTLSPVTHPSPLASFSPAHPSLLRFLVYRVQRTMCGHSWTTLFSARCCMQSGPFVYTLHLILGFTSPRRCIVFNPETYSLASLVSQVLVSDVSL
jgi:hypothetical protein